MSSYIGEIIEESLTKKDLLKKVKVVSTRVEQVTQDHKTPWLSQWTLHKIEVPEENAERLAQEMSQSFDSAHPASWYVDFKNETHHYIIFPNKVFYIDRSKKEEYERATEYGISLGIPSYQVDFSPNIVNWKR